MRYAQTHLASVGCDFSLAQFQGQPEHFSLFPCQEGLHCSDFYFFLLLLDGVSQCIWCVIYSCEELLSLRVSPITGLLYSANRASKTPIMCQQTQSSDLVLLKAVQCNSLFVSSCWILLMERPFLLKCQRFLKLFMSHKKAFKLVEAAPCFWHESGVEKGLVSPSGSSPCGDLKILMGAKDWSVWVQMLILGGLGWLRCELSLG